VTDDGKAYWEEWNRSTDALIAAMTDEPGTEQPEMSVERRVDAVIDDLTKGRVVPRQVDQLAGAVARARTDGALGRAIGGRRDAI